MINQNWVLWLTAWDSEYIHLFSFLQLGANEHKQIEKGRWGRRASRRGA